MHILKTQISENACTHPENIVKYKQICRKHIYAEMKGMYREAGGSLKFPFLAPGSSQYLDMLWDWDSWLSNVALRQILLDKGTDKDRKDALKYEQGCVLNSLSYGGMDGWIPIWIERNAPSRDEMLKTRNPWKSNMHKPTLAQHAAFIIQQMNGDAEWLRDDFYTLQAFVSKYLNFHQHKLTGLMYWETDEAIGVDNDPSTFYRPNASSGSIFLNALMYKELKAMAYIANCLKQPDIANTYATEAQKLVNQVRERFGALHEYYLPDNDEPVLNKGFQNWNFLVLNMAAWLDGQPVIAEF